jgi:hypothetical protein
MALVAAFREFVHGVGSVAATFPKPKQHVVVPVEYQLHCELLPGRAKTI